MYCPIIGMQATVEGSHSSLHVTLCSVYCKHVPNHWLMLCPILIDMRQLREPTMVYMLHCAQFIVIVYLM